MALTKKQIEEFRCTIAKRREALLAEIQGDVARSRDESYAAIAGRWSTPPTRPLRTCSPTWTTRKRRAT